MILDAHIDLDYKNNFRWKYDFDLGDHVKIIKNGWLYSSFSELANFLRLENWKQGSLKTSENAFIIIQICCYRNSKFIVAIRNVKTSKEYLIAPQGLKLMDKEEIMKCYNFEEFIKEEEFKV